MAAASSEQPKPQIKHDWYQTDVQVAITILLKNVDKDILEVNFGPKSVQATVTYPDQSPIEFQFNLLHEIVPYSSTYHLTPSKIEIKLRKKEGLRWSALEGENAELLPKEIPIEAPKESGPLCYPTSRKGKDWNAVEKEIKAEEAKDKPEGEEALNKLFQEIYGKGSDEVKRAMNKSYMESGGTVLSTNWQEIAKDKVEVKPPDGMEWKKW